MTSEPDIPVPIRFNPMKHHRNYMLHVLKYASHEEIVSALEPVCNNYNDIYTGELSPAEIGKEIIQKLQEENAFLSDDYAQWLRVNKGFCTLQLSDSSEWIVRLGNEPGHYIHLHPSRNGKFTIRIKGSSLKTVFLIKAMQDQINDSVSLGDINKARMQIGLSPIKKTDRNKGIQACYKRFFPKE